MIKSIYIFLFGILFLFSCKRDDNGGSSQVNQIPSIPDLVFPTQNLVCTNFNLEFDWGTATDADGDTINYIIDIATDSNFSTVIFTATTTNTSNSFTLEKGTTYFWRVKAKDSAGNESGYSDTYSFYTEPDAGTHTLPNPPSIVSPTLGQNDITAGTVTLNWNAGDSDTQSYDVYFGETNPPTLFAENVTSSTTTATASSNKVYYWRVVVKDSHQNAAIGQVWNFRTE